ncbi:MAG: twin-arginine translocase TatA/TatE family subunit [Candidatus Atribacteria bacterium]|nr:twin-arginine translocase TatA/TatE family subunit [Candidatus Atribacteria bacterium]
MLHFGTTELIIILVIVVLLFGVGRIGKIAGELGKGVRDFRSGLTGKEDEGAKQAEEAKTKEEEKADQE